MKGGHNRIHCAPRRCELCQFPIARERYPSGTLEKPKDYSRRKFCTVACYQAHRKRQARNDYRFWQRLTQEYVGA